jgi:Natural resistance-associated macrophage protein
VSTVTRARTVRHTLALAARRHTRMVAFAAVVGPGVLAGRSDDDPAGITTYSILGADFGYRLLWVLLLSTVALIVFHELGARMGCVTGRGLAGLIRDRYGHGAAVSAAGVLLVANASAPPARSSPGSPRASDLAGISRYASVPLQQSSFRRSSCGAGSSASSTCCSYLRRCS